MTRLASCNAPSKSLRSYRRRARLSGSTCAKAECAQEKNKTATKIQLTLFIHIVLSKPSRRPKPRRRNELFVLDFVERLSRHQIIDSAVRFYSVNILTCRYPLRQGRLSDKHMKHIRIFRDIIQHGSMKTRVRFLRFGRRRKFNYGLMQLPLLDNSRIILRHQITSIPAKRVHALIYLSRNHINVYLTCLGGQDSDIVWTIRAAEIR